MYKKIGFHNGIIENFQTLKDQLLKKGHIFISETDTEIFAHLVEEHTKTEDFTTAVRNAFHQLTGLNAFLVMHAVSSEIIGIKNGSPLAVGVGTEENFIASDASALLPHTRKVIFLEDDQMVSITQDGIKILSIADGHEVPLNIQVLDWKVEEAEKGKYPYFLLKEIYEQPESIEKGGESK